MAGDVALDRNEFKILGPYVSLTPWALNPEWHEMSQRPDPEDWSSSWDDQVQIVGGTIVFTMPYPTLQAKSGDVLRLCFDEAAQDGWSGGGITEDRWLRLK